MACMAQANQKKLTQAALVIFVVAIQTSDSPFT
jgi:hypothetical protein